MQRVCCGSAGFRVATGLRSDPPHRATSAHGRLTHDGGRTKEPPGSMVRGGSLVSVAATCGVGLHGSRWWRPRRLRRRWPLRIAPIGFVWHSRISWTVGLCNDRFSRQTGLDPMDRPIACSAYSFLGRTSRPRRGVLARPNCSGQRQTTNSHGIAPFMNSSATNSNAARQQIAISATAPATTTTRQPALR